MAFSPANWNHGILTCHTMCLERQIVFFFRSVAVDKTFNSHRWTRKRLLNIVIKNKCVGTLVGRQFFCTTSGSSNFRQLHPPLFLFFSSRESCCVLGHSGIVPLFLMTIISLITALTSVSTCRLPLFNTFFHPRLGWNMCPPVPLCALSRCRVNLFKYKIIAGY